MIILYLFTSQIIGRFLIFYFLKLGHSESILLHFFQKFCASCHNNISQKCEFNLFTLFLLKKSLVDDKKSIKSL